MTVKQIQINNTNYDLDNRYIFLNGKQGSSGTLTNDQLAILQASPQNYIIYMVGSMFCTYRRVISDRLPDDASGDMYFSYGDSSGRVQWCYVHNTSYSFSTTSPEVRSDNNTSKLYLIGGESQNVSGTTTHSNSDVYEQAGVLYANQITLTNTPSNDTDAATKKYVDDAIGNAMAASY